MEKMKILIVQGTSNTQYPSGELSVIYNEQSELSKKNEVNVELITPRPSSVTSLILRAFDIVWSWRNYQKVSALIDKYQPDVIHFHTISLYLSISVLYAARKKGVAVVQTLHNMRWLCVEGGFYRNGQYCDACTGNFGWRGVVNGCSRGRIASFLLFFVNYYSRVNGRLFGLVDRFVAVSEFVKLKHVSSGFPAEQIEVNNNGINLSELVRKGYERGWSEREGMAYAGRVSIAKGSAVLEYLIPRLDQPIHIIGYGPEMDALQANCLKNGYDHVKFWGKLDHEKTLQLLGAVVCTVVPSQCGETFSLVAAESMALGTPVIVSNLGGVSGLVEKSGGGRLVEPRNFNGFVIAVIDLLRSREDAKILGMKGKEYVSKALLLENIVSSLADIYKNVVDMRHREIT